MGVSDWDFLRPPGMDPSEDEESLGKRPSLDDFDGEIAVFQVSGFTSPHELWVLQFPASHSLQVQDEAFIVLMYFVFSACGDSD